MQKPFSSLLYVVVAALALYALYFLGLTATGLLGPDEVRYAAIGRQMGHSGDWVTPRLWGEAWFEKPVLLYWMTAAAFRCGLNEDLAPRLPVAVLSVGFLCLFRWILARELGARAAWLSTVVLATSAGWLALSHVAVTDLPMSAFFATGMLLCLEWLRTGNRRNLPFAAAAFALAVLAKGLVPLVLALPLAWFGRKRLADLVRLPVILTFTVIAAPWYLLCYARQGAPFLEKFFWEHHFGRFSTGALLHLQPFWFYLPILAAALFPWAPALAFLTRPAFYSDVSRRFLLVWAVFGVSFFSLSANKLPSYILPLLPAMAALIGLALAETGGERWVRWILAASASLLCLVVPLAAVLPQALSGGLSRSTVPAPEVAWGAPLLVAGVVWLLATRGRPGFAVNLLAAAICAAVVYLDFAALPAIDQAASARSLWKQIAGSAAEVCVEKIHRNWRYGLNYYSVTPLPDCEETPRPVHVRQVPGSPPRAVPVGRTSRSASRPQTSEPPIGAVDPPPVAVVISAFPYSSR